jgi:hypothetical protein
MAFTHGIRLRCVAMQLDRVRPIRAGRSRIRRGSETDLDEQIVSGAFRERQNSAPHPDNPRSECQHRMPHVRDTGRYGASVAQVGLQPRNLPNLHRCGAYCRRLRSYCHLASNPGRGFRFGITYDMACYQQL